MRPAPPTRREAVQLAIARAKLALARADGDSLRIALLLDRCADLEATLGLARGEDPSGGDADPLEASPAEAWLPYKDT